MRGLNPENSENPQRFDIQHFCFLIIMHESSEHGGNEIIFFYRKETEMLFCAHLPRIKLARDDVQLKAPVRGVRLSHLKEPVLVEHACACHRSLQPTKNAHARTRTHTHTHSKKIPAIHFHHCFGRKACFLGIN